MTNTNVTGGKTPLVPTQPSTTIPVADADHPVEHVADRPAAALDKTPPPPPTKHGAAVLSQYRTVNADSEGAKKNNPLRAFMSSLAPSTQGDSASETTENADGSVADHASEIASHDGTQDTDIQPSYFGGLGANPAPNSRIQRKINDHYAKQAKENAIRGPLEVTLAPGNVARGRLAQQIKAVREATPEHAFERMGGIKASQNPKERIDMMNAESIQAEPITMQPKVPVHIPGRDSGAFAAARAKFSNAGTTAPNADHETANVHVPTGPNVKDMIANIERKKPA